MSVIGLVSVNTTENSNILSICNKYELFELIPDNYKLTEKPMDACFRDCFAFGKTIHLFVV